VLDHPLTSAVFVPAVLVTFIGIAGLLIGFTDLFASFRGAGWGMGPLGVSSVLLGGALLFNTLIGVALMPYLLGVVELVGGLVAFFVAFKLRTRPAR
jgi:uncharacterized membrane protein HdeD (DUF308 family)